MRRVWGEKGGGNVEALRSAVAKLRRGLGDYARKPRYVIGVRGLTGSAAFAKSRKASTCHDPDRSSAENLSRSRRSRGGLWTETRYADIVSNSKTMPPCRPSSVWNSDYKP